MRVRARLLYVSFIVIALALELPALLGVAFSYSEDGLVSLQILAINDLHGHIDQTETLGGRPVGGAAYLATYIFERRAEAANTICVHAGDAIGASPPISGLLQDEPAIEVLSFMGFDVGVAGNHEFDEGLAELYRLQYGGFHESTGYFPGSSFPLVLSNVVLSESGHPAFPPYVIKVVEGIPVAFIGVVTAQLPEIVLPTGVAGLGVIDPVAAVNYYVERLREKGVEAIVVLAHEGGYLDESGAVVGAIADFAYGVSDSVDVIISGHTHQGYVAQVDGKLVTQAYSKGTAFVDIDLLMSAKTGDVVEATAELVTVWADTKFPDARIEMLLEIYRATVEPLTDRPIATVAVRLEMEDNGHGESALGNLVADSQRWISGAQIAFVNSGGIRADLGPGLVTWGDLYDVLPFGNDIVLVRLSGEQVLRALNQQWQVSGDQVRTKFLQLSGMAYCYDDSRPLGDRIVLASLADGTPIHKDSVYTVAINSYLYYGGDGFTVFREAADARFVANDLEALVTYLKSFDKPVYAEIEGRITRCSSN